VPQADSCTAAKCHSITSSARASSVGGTVRPSALAVFRLIFAEKRGYTGTGVIVKARDDLISVMRYAVMMLRFAEVAPRLQRRKPVRP